jgi:glycolate oxidase FAD binding subunit
MTAPWRPATVDALRAAVADAHASRTGVPRVDLSALDRVLAYSPDDLTVTVEAGITVAALQQALAPAGQWLPVDPPHAATTTVADLLQYDVSGPRRFGYGTVREHVLGMAVVTGDGRLVRTGGRVVKNVAGYDLAKLFIGDRRTLGIVVEATFKLMPRPADERIVTLSHPSLEVIGAQLDAVLAGPTSPVVVDLHSLDRDAGGWTLVLAFAGHPDDVAWEVATLDAAWQVRDALDYEARFWDGRRFDTVARTSVLPSTLVRHLEAHDDGDVVCRAGNGVIYVRDLPRAATGPAAGTSSPAIAELTRRLVETFDPHGVFRRAEVSS